VPTDLLNQETGQVERLDDTQLLPAFQSGKYAFIKGDDYAFKDPQSGETKLVGADEASQLLSKGHQLDTQADTSAMRLQQEYGKETSGLGEYARGFLNTISFGGADALDLAAAEAIGGKEARHELSAKMEASEELHKGAHYAGAATGFVAPLLLTGGASGAAALAEEGGILGKGAAALAKVGELGAAPMNVLNEIGGIGGKVTGALVGEASESALVRILQKGLKSGADAAVQGGLIGVADQLHEDALGDHELNGEKVAGAFGHGAFYGGMMGAGLGATGEALSSGAKWAVTKASPMAKAFAEEQAVRSLSYGGLAPKAYMNQLERIQGGMRGVGRELLDSGVVKMGDTFEQIAPKARAAADEAGQGLTEGLRKLDAQISGPKTADVVGRVSEAMEGKFGKLRESQASTFNKINTLMQDFASSSGGENVTLEGLRDFRRLVDNEIRWAAPAPGAPMNATQEALKSVRGVMESELEKTIDQAGESLSGDALKEYKTLKLKYQRLNAAADMAEDSATRANKNQMFGVTDKALAGAGIIHGLATGNPLVAATGIATSALHHVAQQRGNSTAAVALDKLSDLIAIRKTVESMDERMSNGVAGFLEGKPPQHEPVLFRSAKARDEAFDQVSKRVRIASSDPEKAADSVSRALQGAYAHAPKIARSATSAAARAAVFLAAKLPPNPPPRSITPQFEKPSVDPATKDKFLRYAKAADDPLSVVDDMAKGRLTREGVETIREVYPKLFESLQKEALTKCSDLQKPISYDQKLQLGLLLDVPTDSTLEPQFIARMQQTYAEEAQASQGHPSGPSRQPLQEAAGSTALNGANGHDRANQ
jgi:hypothetical protein